MSSIDTFDFEVDRTFRFLADDFGFSCPTESVTNESGERHHRYEYENWFISPYYYTYENGINVKFGNGEPAKKALTIHMYMRLVDPEMFYRLGAAIAHDESDIEPLLELYARALQTSGRAILVRDNSACLRLQHAMKLGEGMCPSYSEQPGDRMIVSRYV